MAVHLRFPARSERSADQLHEELPYPLGAEPAGAEVPLTSEPPLRDAEPLTSEPPLSDESDASTTTRP